MSQFKALLPSIIPVLVLIASSLAPQAQSFISGHPLVSLSLASFVAVLNHWLPSPNKQ